MARGRTRSDLDSDRQLNLSLVRLVEVVGEAATRLPEGFRARYPRVPWRAMVGMRNRLIHGYDVIDVDRLWEVVRKDLPRLIRELDAIVDDG